MEDFITAEQLDKRFDHCTSSSELRYQLLIEKMEKTMYEVVSEKLRGMVPVALVVWGKVESGALGVVLGAVAVELAHRALQ